ncbi:MAG: sigma-70 family RNA polymerase sigma factor [Phycisphaerae bacterium]
MRQAAAGGREARLALYERYREAAYAVAFRVTGRSEDALDVVQDAFVKAFESLAGFQQEASFKTWLLRIVSNRSLDLLRARRVRVAASIDAEGDDESPGGIEPADRDAAPPDDGLQRAELSQRVRAALDSLPPEQRAVMAMFALEEMTYGQISEALGIPIGTVMSRLFHARRKLQEALGEDRHSG